MIIPIIDTGYNERKTYTVYTIMSINLLIFVLFNFRSDYYSIVLEDVGLVPANPGIGNIISHMFFHGDWFHLVGNMFHLWFFGRNVERKAGLHVFIPLYFVSGLSAAMLQVVTSLGSERPMIGASGAIAGVLGAYLVLFPKRKIVCAYFALVQTGTIKVASGIFIFVYFAIDLLMALFANKASGVAHWAHVGGLAFGAGSAYLLFKVIGYSGTEEIVPIVEDKDTIFEDFSELEYIPDIEGEMNLPPIDEITLPPVEDTEVRKTTPKKKRNFKPRRRRTE